MYELEGSGHLLLILYGTMPIFFFFVFLFSDHDTRTNYDVRSVTIHFLEALQTSSSLTRIVIPNNVNECLLKLELEQTSL